MTDLFSLIKEESCGYCPDDGYKMCITIENVMKAAKTLHREIDCLESKTIETKKFGVLKLNFIFGVEEQCYEYQINHILKPRMSEYIKAAQKWCNRVKLVGVTSTYKRPVKTIEKIPLFQKRFKDKLKDIEYEFEWPTAEEFIGLFFMYGEGVKIGYKRYHLHGN